MCNHQVIPETLNCVESSKLERILGNLCIWFHLGKNHLSSKPTIEVSALWWQLIKKEENLSFSDQPVSLKQKVQHASAPGDYGGLVCLCHSLLSALGVGVGVCISLLGNLKILVSASQVNKLKKQAPSIFCSAQGSLPAGQSLPPYKVRMTHTHSKGLTVDRLFVVCFVS